MKPINLLGGSLKIHPVFLAVVILAVFFGNAGLVMAFLLAICIHECAHMLTARAVGLGVESLYVLPFGCAAEISGYGGTNAAREMLTAAAGPVFNILTASMFTLLPPQYMDSYVLLFIWVNVTLAAVNMLPVLPLDGGRILMAALKSYVSERTAWRALNWGGVLAGLGMCGMGAYMLVGGSVNPTWLILGVFFVCARRPEPAQPTACVLPDERGKTQAACAPGKRECKTNCRIADSHPARSAAGDGIVQNEYCDCAE